VEFNAWPSPAGKGGGGTAMIVSSSFDVLFFHQRKNCTKTQRGIQPQPNWKSIEQPRKLDDKSESKPLKNPDGGEFRSWHGRLAHASAASAVV
jgi:hypothetical protein